MNELDSILFSPRKYEERYYFSFWEVLSLGDYQEKFNYEYKESDFTAMLEHMADTLTYFETPIWNSDSGYSDLAYPKLIDILVRRYNEKLCFYSDSESYDEGKAFNFIAKMLNLIEMTAPRYLAILKVYDDNKNNLMNPVSIVSEGISRFNDTPQDEGDFANDEHTTNLTQDHRETSNDIDTIMGRIKEIESNYNNVLLDWSNEFERLFIEEANI